MPYKQHQKWTDGRMDYQWRLDYAWRSFAVQGPRVWNSLPAELRDPDIAMDTFRNRLKTFLFDMQL